MATINISITAPSNQLNKFADELGYFPKVLDENDVVVDNPQNRQSFLQDYFKQLTVNELARVRIKAIENAVRDERETEKQALRTSLNSNVTATFTP